MAFLGLNFEDEDFEGDGRNRPILACDRLRYTQCCWARFDRQGSKPSPISSANPLFGLSQGELAIEPNRILLGSIQANRGA
jgi:hypothetical protein